MKQEPDDDIEDLQCSSLGQKQVWVEPYVAKGFAVYRKDHAEEAHTESQLAEIVGMEKEGFTQNPQEERLVGFMLQITRHGTPVTSFRYSWWMGIKLLVMQLNGAGMATDQRQVLTMALNVRAKGGTSKHHLFQLMAPKSEKGPQEVYIRTDPRGAPHTITDKGLRVEPTEQPYKGGAKGSTKKGKHN